MGPMRAGKSYEIIRLIHQCEILGLQITKIIPSLDSRSDGEIKSRTGTSSKALKITDLSEVSFETFTATNVFVLDEAQFLKGLKEFVIKCKNSNKTVFISGLDGDFKRNPIGEVLDCIPHCDEVVKLTALCMKELDGTPAIFSYLVNKKNVDGQVLVGDSEFLSLSRKAFLSMEN
jgi:thymidine kinase